MAFDSKRLRTFKLLESISNSQSSYCKNNFPRFPQIMVRDGQFYATNEIVLAKVEYPEFEHLSDYVWSNVKNYTGEDGLLLQIPEIEEREKQFLNNNIFDQFLNLLEDRYVHANEKPIDCKVLEHGLKGFKINGISPLVYTAYDRIILCGHNKDVSMRVMMMGKSR